MKKARITLFVSCNKYYIFAFLLVLLYGCEKQRPDTELMPEKVSVFAEFRFLSLPSQRARSVRYDVVIEDTDSRLLEEHLPINARLYCTRDCMKVIEPNSSYKARIFLQKIDYPENPSSFNYQSWLDRNAIMYTGKLFTNTLAMQSSGTRTWHGRFIVWLQKQLEQHEFGWHYLALLTGFRGPLAKQDIDLLVNTGTMHLLVVSGLHLGFIFALIFTVARFLLPGSYLWASVAGLSAMLAYAWLAGFALATQRAFIMAAVAITWFLLGKRINPWHGWAFALLAVFALNQPSVQDAGLWLSFGTVALLLVTFFRQNKQHNGLSSLLVSQWYIFPGLSLLQAFFFDRFGMATFLANIIAIPFIGLMALPVLLFSCLLLLFVPTLGHKLLDLLDWAFDVFWQVLLWVERLPWSSQLLAGERLDAPVLFAIIACLAVIQLLPRQTPGKMWAWLFIALLTLPIYSSKRKQAEVWLIESRDNSHLVYRQGSYALVISLAQDDAIDAASIRYDVVPTLRYFDVSQVDWTTLAQQATFDKREVEGLLRQEQTLNVLAPCQLPSSLLEVSIKWHKVSSGCILEMKSEAGSLLFLPELLAADVVAFDKIVDDSAVVYGGSMDSLLLLGQANTQRRERKCFLPNKLPQQQRLSFCSLSSIDHLGAVRFEPSSWRAYYDFIKN